MVRISSLLALAAIVGAVFPTGVAVAQEAAGRTVQSNPGVHPQPVAAEASATATAPGAGASIPAQDWETLREAVARQGQQLEEQARQLEEQAQWLGSYRQALEEQHRQLDAVQLRLVRGAGAAAGAAEGAPAPAAEGAGQPAQAEEPGRPVGEPAREPTRREELAGVREVGGVLTPKGVLVAEPSIQYSQSAINRFFFAGIEIVETILIGQIEATDSDRDTLIGASTVRYGVTDRLEAEVKVPVVYRKDRIIRQVISTQEETRRELDAFDIGDLEATVRYQINRAFGRWPIFVANLRVKSNTGVGPFDVDRDEDGIETELPTGSGFWGFQPGITALYPSDPAVFFANVNYLWHMERDVDEQVGQSLIGNVDPGDVIGVTFGMALGINPRTSLSIGYEHNFIQETITEINGVDFESETLDVGLLQFGFGYALTERIGLHLNLQAGITEDAPDITLTLRVPIRFVL